jgi:hypothetical protein
MYEIVTWMYLFGLYALKTLSTLFLFSLFSIDSLNDVTKNPHKFYFFCYQIFYPPNIWSRCSGNRADCWLSITRNTLRNINSNLTLLTSLNDERFQFVWESE